MKWLFMPIFCLSKCMGNTSLFVGDASLLETIVEGMSKMGCESGMFGKTGLIYPYAHFVKNLVFPNISLI